MKEERSAAGRKTLGMSGRKLAHAEHDEQKIKIPRKNSEHWGEFDMLDQNFRDHGPPTQGTRESSPSSSSMSASGPRLRTESRLNATDNATL
jgi:hypothetical protein